MLKIDNVKNESQVSNLNSPIEALTLQSTQFSQVIAEIEKCMEFLQKNSEKFPWENRECYAEWLAQCYYQTSYTPRFEALALSRCSSSSDLFPFFVESLKGEL